MVALLILAVTITLATLLVYQDLEEISQLEKAIQDESALRMQNCSEKLVDYFDAVYSTLLFISLDNDVVAMRRDSRDFLQKIYDHQWENHLLTEIYVLGRDFQPDAKPFMTFERGSEEESVEEVHSLAREQDEYRAQIEHIRRFDANPGFQGLLSGELRLCTTDKQGVAELGRVYSVPIRSSDKLVGIVAGMIQEQSVLQILRSVGTHRTALLVNERGDILADPQADSKVLIWFKQQFASTGVNGIFAGARGTFEVEGRTALWTTAQILPAEKWWLVYLYQPAAELHSTRFSGLFGHLALAGCMVLAGGSISVLVWILGRRLEDNHWHLQERKQLEWQVQEVSDRVQRRIGRDLREELCQRLAGVSAFSTALTRKLEALKVPEAQLASEITQEIMESLAGAAAMADELQEVPLLQHGFLAATRKLASHTEARSGIPCRVEEAAFPLEVELAVATQLFRIVQEAVLNAARYSRAAHIVIRLSGSREQLAIAVLDDGIGDAQELNQAPGLGLRIMRYRSELIGAQLEILPAPTRGIIVRCTCSATHPGDAGHARKYAT